MVNAPGHSHDVMGFAETSTANWANHIRDEHREVWDEPSNDVWSRLDGYSLRAIHYGLHIQIGVAGLYNKTPSPGHLEDHGVYRYGSLWDQNIDNRLHFGIHIMERTWSHWRASRDDLMRELPSWASSEREGDDMNEYVLKAEYLTEMNICDGRAEVEAVLHRAFGDGTNILDLDVDVNDDVPRPMKKKTLVPASTRENGKLSTSRSMEWAQEAKKELEQKLESRQEKRWQKRVIVTARLQADGQRISQGRAADDLHARALTHLGRSCEGNIVIYRVRKEG